MLFICTGIMLFIRTRLRLAIFITNVFHVIEEASSFIFYLGWQFFTDAEIFKLERLTNDLVVFRFIFF